MKSLEQNRERTGKLECCIHVLECNCENRMGGSIHCVECVQIESALIFFFFFPGIAQNKHFGILALILACNQNALFSFSLETTANVYVCYRRNGKGSKALVIDSS